MKTLIFTGGHHNSALPVALELKKQGWNIVWIGHRHSMWGDTADSAEYKEVTTTGIEFHDLIAGKFYNNFNPKKLIRIPWGFIQVASILATIRKKHQVTGIVSFGGYLAVPTVAVGYLFGIPSITHEQTVVAGWANKFISHFVKKIAVSWPESLPLYPKEKTVFTGLPLRPELVNLKNNPKTTIQSPTTIYITGGKQGSHTINAAVFEILPKLTSRFTVIHQTGTSTLYNDLAQAKKFASPKYKPFGYDSQQAIDALAKAGVVISRSGAHITYELSYLKRKCVLIPLPNVSHDEQYQNAKVLADQGLAVILPQSQLSPESLLDAIDKCVSLTPRPGEFVTDGLLKLVELINNNLDK